MALHCRVVFAFLFLPLARAAWDNRNIQFAKMTGVTYEDEDEDAFTDLRLWTAAIEELLKLAPEASRERLLAGMRLVDKQWDTTFEAYAAAKEAKRSTADVLAPSFPGRQLYLDAMRHPENTIQGWQPSLIVAVIDQMIVVKGRMPDDVDLQLEHLFISSNIIEDEATLMREDHERVGHDAKVVAVMLAFVVQLAANGRKEAAVAHYKAYLEAITTDPDYQEQYNSLSSALVRNASRMTTTVIRTHRPNLLSGVRIVSTLARQSVTSNTHTIAAPAVAGENPTAELEALFADCSLYHHLQVTVEDPTI